jgi:ParB/RepB/Spo0J family partition protein
MKEESRTKEVKTEFFTSFSDEQLDQYLEKEKKMEKKQNMTQNKTDNSKDVSDMKIVVLDTSSLGVGYHPRRNLGDIESLQGSIKRDGLQEPLLVYEVGDNKYAIIDGCRRFEAVRQFGWLRVPCIIKKGIGTVEAAHLSYVKNEERNGFDPIEIAHHLKAMSEEFGYSLRDLELMGYGSPASIANKMKLLDLAEPVQQRIQKGELTAAHGLELTKLPSKKEQERMANRITDHDLTAKRAEVQIKQYLDKGKKQEEKPKAQVPSTEIAGVYIKDSRDMSELPDKSVHLIVSSPPYNVGLEYEKGVSFHEHLFMVKDVLKECARVLVPGGTMALNVGDINNFKGRNGKNGFTQIQLMGHIYQSYLRKHQIFLTDLIIWKKSLNWKKRPDVSFSEKTAHTSYRILDNFEPVYIFRKKGEREVPPEDIVLQSRLTKEQWTAWTPGVWDIEPVRNQEGHPAVYPDELPRRLIKMYSYEADTVLDPWLGSGTTVKVARELNREAVGYEKEPQYKAVIMKKLGVAPEEAETEAVERMKASIEKIQAEIENQESPVEPVLVDEEKQEATLERADDHFEMGQLD